MKEKTEKLSIYRGHVYMADLDPVKDNEQGGIRPVLVVQNRVGNMNAPTIIVAPLTSQLKVPMPTHVEFMNPEGEINTILLEHLRSISRSRFRRYKWTLDSTTMNMVDAAIAVSVGLIPLPPAPAFQLHIFQYV